jgi:hypothetical protein
MKLFNWNKKDKKAEVTLINQDEVLAKQDKEIKKFIEDNGQNFATNLTWQNGAEFSLDKFPPVAYIRENYQGLINNVGALYDKNHQIFKTNYNKYDSEFGGNTVEEKDVNIKIEELVNEREAVLDEATQNHDDDINDKKERANELKDDIKNNRKDLKAMRKWNLVPRKIIAGFVMLMLVLGEVFLNKDAFDYAGFLGSASFFIGIGIATGTFILGVGKATIIRNPKHSLMTKIGSGIGIFLLVAIVYYFLGTIRVSEMANQGDNEGIFALSPIYFAGFNLIFFIGIFIAKLVIYPSPKMISDNENYEVKNTELSKNLKEHRRLQQEIASGYKTREQKRKAIQKSYDASIIPLEQGIKAENDEIRQSALDFNQEVALARNFYKQTSAHYKANAASLINTINLYKNSDKDALVMTELKELENPFAGITLLVLNSSKESSKDKVSQSGISDWKVITENGETNYSFINPEK